MRRTMSMAAGLVLALGVAAPALAAPPQERVKLCKAKHVEKGKVKKCTPVDTTAPTATFSLVEESQRRVTVSFSEPVKAATVTLDDFSLSGTTGPFGTLLAVPDADGSLRSAVLDLGRPLQTGQTLALRAGSVEDLAGNAGPTQDVVWTAGRDVTAPTFDYFPPVVGVQSVVLRTGDSLLASSVTKDDFVLPDGVRIFAITVEPNNQGAQIAVSFLDRLEAGQSITLKAGSVTDAAGNAGPAAPFTVTSRG